METTEFIECNPQKNEAGKFGYKNAKGEVIIPFEYDAWTYYCKKDIEDKKRWFTSKT